MMTTKRTGLWKDSEHKDIEHCLQSNSEHLSKYIGFLKNQSENCTAFTPDDRPSFRQLADTLSKEYEKFAGLYRQLRDDTGEYELYADA